MQSRDNYLSVAACIAGFLSLGAFRAEAQNSQRISVSKAEQLVAGWVQAHKPHDGSAWHSRPRLKELTPPDLWERAGAQVFKQVASTSSVEGVDSYLIKAKKVYPLSTGFPGGGLGSMWVCDLNHDSKLELVYTYSSGSGVDWSHIGVVRLDTPTPVRIETELASMNAPLTLQRQSDQTINVYFNPFPVSGGKSAPMDQALRKLLLGRLVLAKKGGQETLAIQYDPSLTQEQRNRVQVVKRQL